MSGTQVVAKRFAELVAELTAELGPSLTPSQRMLVEQLADLKMRARKADAVQAVRIANASAKLLAMLKPEREQRQDEPSALSKYLASLEQDDTP